MSLNELEFLRIHATFFSRGGLGIFMGLYVGALDNPLIQEEMQLI